MTEGGGGLISCQNCVTSFMNAPYWWGWGVVGGVGGGGGGMGFNRNSLSDGSYDATYKKIQSIFNISYSEDPDFEPKN